MPISSNSRFWLFIGLSYWLIAGILGLILRLLKSGFMSGLPFQYFLHTHSHVAMLGWVYMAIITGIIYLVYGEQGFQKFFFKVIFWLTQIAVIGMLFTFPFQGYGAYSIAFSTLHILLSYALAWYLFRHWQSRTRHLNPLVRKFLAGSLVFMIFSSLGPWALAYIGAQGLKNTHWYEQAIYFYLHFQYNGWFTFALIGFWIHLAGKNLTTNKRKLGNWAFWGLFTATLPAYFLSLLGYDLPMALIITAIISAILQFTGFSLLLIPFLGRQNDFVQNVRLSIRLLFYIALISLIAKFLMQTLSIFPSLHAMAFNTREVIVGYLHLAMLGFASSGLVYWYYKQNLLISSHLFIKGIVSYLVGFLGMESLLFLQGMAYQLDMGMIAGFNMIIIAFTVFLVIGIGLLTSSQLTVNKN